MTEMLKQFVGDEQIQSFLKTYPNTKELVNVFDLFHISEKNIRKVVVVRQEDPDRYLIQFHTRHGILCLKDDEVI